MVFSSSVFLLMFAPIVLIVYYILPAKLRNLGLLIASLIFYAWGEPKYIFIMLFSTVFDYTNGLLLDKFKSNQKIKKSILISSVVVNLGLLGFFKYTNFAISTINDIFGSGITALNVALPIGISFYTFQTMSYVFDVYSGRVKVQKNIISFGMYISMFPQLIAGPIVRYSDIEAQINNRKINTNQITEGIFRFVFGLAKKVLLANQFGAIWDEISASENVPVVTAWIGAVAFMLQIYFDFSGYSDMAIGLGKMLGFEFPENFNYPYESRSITEFWRRWHISLSSWFKEYVYIPLGGSQRGVPRQIINLFVVWLLTGLWHGAGWNFILWGLYFFVILLLEKFLLCDILKKLPAFLQHTYALLVVLLSWVIFACDTPELLRSYMSSLFGANGFANSTSIYYITNNLFIIIFGVFFSTSIFKRIVEKKRFSLALKIAICVILYVVCIAFVATDNYNPFLYFRF